MPSALFWLCWVSPVIFYYFLCFSVCLFVCFWGGEYFLFNFVYCYKILYSQIYDLIVAVLFILLSDTEETTRPAGEHWFVNVKPAGLVTLTEGRWNTGLCSKAVFAQTGTHLFSSTVTNFKYFPSNLFSHKWTFWQHKIKSNQKLL